MPNVALSYTCAASARRAHGSDKLHVDKLPECVLLAVVPSSMVHPLPQYFNWWLCAVCLLRGHVEVIYEDDASDSQRRAKHAFAALVELRIDGVLSLHMGKPLYGGFSLLLELWLMVRSSGQEARALVVPWPERFCG